MTIQIPGGFYLSIDGPDGCGKTTQYRLLEDQLTSDGYNMMTMREPGSTSLSERIRNLLLRDKDIQFSDEVQMLLFQTARRDNFDQIVIPALKAGKLILADRSFDSTTAYQGYGGGIDIDVINWLNKYATQGHEPNLSIILDIKAEKGLENLTGPADKIEARGSEYHKKVREGYLEIAKQNPHRCVVISYIDGDPNEVHKQVYEVSKARIKKALGK